MTVAEARQLLHTTWQEAAAKGKHGPPDPLAETVREALEAVEGLTKEVRRWTESLRRGTADREEATEKILSATTTVQQWYGTVLQRWTHARAHPALDARTPVEWDAIRTAKGRVARAALRLHGIRQAVLRAMRPRAYSPSTNDDSSGRWSSSAPASSPRRPPLSTSDWMEVHRLLEGYAMGEDTMNAVIEHLATASGVRADVVVHPRGLFYHESSDFPDIDRLVPANRIVLVPVADEQHWFLLCLYRELNELNEERSSWIYECDITRRHPFGLQLPRRLSLYLPSFCVSNE
jgi:hypothetical protein